MIFIRLFCRHIDLPAASDTINTWFCLFAEWLKYFIYLHSFPHEWISSSIVFFFYFFFETISFDNIDKIIEHSTINFSTIFTAYCTHCWYLTSVAQKMCTEILCYFHSFHWYNKNMSDTLLWCRISYGILVL